MDGKVPPRCQMLLHYVQNIHFSHFQVDTDASLMLLNGAWNDFLFERSWTSFVVLNRFFKEEEGVVSFFNQHPFSSTPRKRTISQIRSNLCRWWDVWGQTGSQRHWQSFHSQSPSSFLPSRPALQVSSWISHGENSKRQLSSFKNPLLMSLWGTDGMGYQVKELPLLLIWAFIFSSAMLGSLRTPHSSLNLLFLHIINSPARNFFGVIWGNELIMRRSSDAKSDLK